jgi:hypothetical protein
MIEKKELIIDKEASLVIGNECVIDSSVENFNTVVFEDDGQTGYFYAVEIGSETRILDALHIYNVNDVIDREIPSTLKILWTVDHLQAFLTINDYFHAAFDFENKAGYCRNGFPDANSWTKIKERKLTDELLIELAKK